MIDYPAAGCRIKNRRRELGLTQEYVAERIDITPSFYSQIESGTRKAGIKTFVCISQELSLPLGYILCGRDNLPLKELSHIDLQIIHRIKDFSLVEKECVLELVNSLNKVFNQR